MANQETQEPIKVGKFELQQHGAFVARTMFQFEYGGNFIDSPKQTGNQLAGQTYGIEPAELGIEEGATLKFHLWVMAGYDRICPQEFIYDYLNPNVAIMNCSNITANPHLNYIGLKQNPNFVTSAQNEEAQKVGNAICAAIGSGRTRSADNPTLIQLSADPMQALIDFGLPKDTFANSNQDVVNSFLNDLKTKANEEINALKNADGTHELQTRGFFKCWACRIGFGIVFALVGLAISVATMGVGGAIYVAAINYMVALGLGVATAAGLMAAATATGGISAAGGVAALIEFICEKIPGTC